VWHVLSVPYGVGSAAVSHRCLEEIELAIDDATMLLQAVAFRVA